MRARYAHSYEINNNRMGATINERSERARPERDTTNPRLVRHT